ncbi:E3 ubiquitin-protein ligase MARCH5-like [Ctenocephalides felis]|uniref:E3 ubiquitin-protein ligase MARCH5-like n=1 Tax=Ctenocephalides felis TaxID=7515 RepID=UPI000E6E4C1D|nr:E3 ubiquitin-protein ligase MARCH5-like [Ctenocephalides felis]
MTTLENRGSQCTEYANPVSETPSNESQQRHCWVCFATEEDDANANWVQPCHCKGTSKWVHQSCLQRWVDEKQKDNSFGRVHCPQCQTEYIIVFPPVGMIVLILDGIEMLTKKLSPFLAAGIVVGSVYWTAVTYGAITVMQVVGHKEGMALMELQDPLVLLVGLPAIPIGLVLGKMLRWEDSVLTFIRRKRHIVRKIPLLRNILPTESDSVVNLAESDIPPLSDPVSATRVLCGALVLPTIAVLVGRVLFESIESNFQRTLLGGVAFIAFKGVLKIFHRQQLIVRKSKRKIMDYTDENIAQFGNRSQYGGLSANNSSEML